MSKVSNILITIALVLLAFAGISLLFKAIKFLVSLIIPIAVVGIILFAVGVFFRKTQPSKEEGSEK